MNSMVRISRVVRTNTGRYALKKHGFHCNQLAEKHRKAGSQKQHITLTGENTFTAPCRVCRKE
jgi:hypothetical protein